MRRAASLIRLMLVAGLCGLGLAQAGTYQLYGNTIVNVMRSYPQPQDSDYHGLDANWLNDARATQWLRLDDTAALSAGRAEAKVLAHMGLLKAYASASFPYCCDATGHLIIQGYADAEVKAGFYDSVLVTGAGLAAGTPVSYKLNIRIDGALSQPSFEMGGALAAYGVADIRFTDLSSHALDSMVWQADRDLPGSFSLVLNTAVGHEISVSAMLAVGASVSANARSARSASADFYHSAGFSLSPSLAGLNTQGASGYDYAASAVPEPAQASLLMLGLIGLAGLGRQRRRIHRP
ncbi:PEP-CTERM sorting domain-containing protein [Paucibacter sp. APW11]|uniref:PEP-CTERM sorting domain-containing protein n=1 Tax=Roseateles aquae TaxID=3077235 RepID=A0ABU3P6U2_9BURK|nr:PEP-CTERM sorting domain-containing protein [Paucibacter sp. APW11]MDT8998292.1 PEP-CTERM sorting domain-containing protein [Paucibacter sp. APW11]